VRPDRCFFFLRLGNILQWTNDSLPILIVVSALPVVAVPIRAAYTKMFARNVGSLEAAVIALPESRFGSPAVDTVATVKM
jgi:hypothetical protein